MKVLVLDNYDSFTYNLVHILRELEVDLEVHRNDKITLDEVDRFDKILLSPGPGLPHEAGIMPELLKRFHDSKSILGICLGHQAIAECFGAKLRNLSTVFHGIVSDINQIGSPRIFKELPETFKACRYHSWVIDESSMPSDMLVTSRDADGTIMSVEHQQHDVQGIQFHPESVMTEYGREMLQNWLKK